MWLANSPCYFYGVCCCGYGVYAYNSNTYTNCYYGHRNNNTMAIATLFDAKNDISGNNEFE